MFSPDSQHIAVIPRSPNSTGEYAWDLSRWQVPAGVATRMFYSWSSPPTANTSSGRSRFLVDTHSGIFVDGKAVAETATAIDPNSRESWWDMAPDGSLSFLVRTRII